MMSKAKCMIVNVELCVVYRFRIGASKKNTLVNSR